jgi:hypothetical protein
MNIKKNECMFCGERILEGVFCSEQCKNLAISEADDIDRRIYFLFGKKSNYCQRKLTKMFDEMSTKEERGEDQ